MSPGMMTAECPDVPSSISEDGVAGERRSW